LWIARSPARLFLERRQPTLFEPAIDAALSEPSLQEQVNFVESKPSARESKQISQEHCAFPATIVDARRTGSA
jgi:hypothetical protein